MNGAAFACSPRPDGNSDHAASLFVKGVTAAGGACHIHTLRRFHVQPCLGQGHCEKDPEAKCPLSKTDQAEVLFQTLLSAPYVFFSSPIYFYHLPAVFKAWIDRGQRYYVLGRRKGRDMPDQAARPAYVCLIAGREKGEKLFEGSLLTLKYFLKSFNVVIKETLTFPGYDGPGELMRDEKAAKAIMDMGRGAAMG